MAEKMTYEEFAEGLNPFDASFVNGIHESLIPKGYTVEIKPAAQGPVASYIHKKTKKTVFNYVFRKSGMQVRIYGDNAHKYGDFFSTLPESMQSAIEKATDCRHCNPRCPMGYSVSIKGNDHKKCRYGAFMFALNPETLSYIKEFIERETTERA